MEAGDKGAILVRPVVLPVGGIDGVCKPERGRSLHCHGFSEVGHAVGKRLGFVVVLTAAVRSGNSPVGRPVGWVGQAAVGRCTFPNRFGGRSAGAFPKVLGPLDCPGCHFDAMGTTSPLWRTGCHRVAMGPIGLFFELAILGDEKIGRAYALSGFRMGVFLRATATRRQPVPCLRACAPDALGTAGLFFERAFSLRRPGRLASSRETRPASGCQTAERAVREARGVIAVLGVVVVDVSVVVEPVVNVVVAVVRGLVLDVDIVVLHREEVPGRPTHTTDRSFLGYRSAAPREGRPRRRLAVRCRLVVDRRPATLARLSGRCRRCRFGRLVFIVVIGRDGRRRLGPARTPIRTGRHRTTAHAGPCRRHTGRVRAAPPPVEV